MNKTIRCRDPSLEVLIESIEDFNEHKIDAAEFLKEMFNTYDKLAEKYNICLRCYREKEIKEWTEWHPYGDTEVPEQWLGYFCPKCGKDD